MPTRIFQSSHYEEWLFEPGESLDEIQRPALRVEVLVIAFQSEEWVEAALRSVLNQTFDQDFSVTVHDDGSTDRTCEIVRRVLTSSTVRSTLLRRSSNSFSKFGGRFYRELMISSGAEFIALLDADDVWASESKLTQQVIQLEQDPRASLSFHDFAVTTGRQTEVVRLHPSWLWLKLHKLRGALLFENFIGSSTVLLRREVLNGMDWRGYDSLSVGDYPVWLYLSRHGFIRYCRGPHTLYLDRPTGLSKRRPVLGNLKDAARAASWTIKVESKSGYSERSALWLFLPALSLGMIISKLFQRNMPFSRVD